MSIFTWIYLSGSCYLSIPLDLSMRDCVQPSSFPVLTVTMSGPTSVTLTHTSGLVIYLPIYLLIYLSNYVLI